VTIVIAGVNRLDIVTMNNAIIMHASASDDGPSRVRNSTTITDATDIHASSFSLSTRSLRRPTTGMLKKVHAPPAA